MAGVKAGPLLKLLFVRRFTQYPIALSSPSHLPLSVLPQVLKMKLRMKPNTTPERCPANAPRGHRIPVTDHKKKKEGKSRVPLYGQRLDKHLTQTSFLKKK